MLSVLPQEIVHRIIDLCIDDIGKRYLTLRSVNKQICSYIDSTMRDFIRDHCYVDRSHRVTDHGAFISAMHKRAYDTDPPEDMFIQLEHKYLPITIHATNTGRVYYRCGDILVGGFYIYIGKYRAAFDVYRNLDLFQAAPTVTITHVAHDSERHQQVLDFIREYFTELYEYLMVSHKI
jgi:hypothetical protein